MTLLRRMVMASALIVPLWMLRTILGEDPFNFLDYFEMLGQIYNDDGSIRWRGFIEHQNEHLVLIPKVVIVANVILFDGSRVTLGVFVWLVAAALTAVIAIALRPLLRLTPWGRVLAVWTLLLSVFPIAAQHNFRLAISGTAWTIANLFMVTAVLLAVRGHSLRAGLAGVAATSTYGTGLVVWPALVVVLILQRRFSRRDQLMLVMGAAAVLFERLTPSTSEPRPPLTLWLPTVGRNVTATIGELFTDETHLASVIGLGLVLIALISLVQLRPRWGSTAPSFAVACLVVPAISLVLIAMSRSLLGAEAFGASRYMGVSALFGLFTAVLALLAFGETIVLRTIVLGFGALSLFGTQQVTDDLDAVNRTIRLDSAAVYMGVGERIAQYYFMVSEVVPALGHVPFDGSFDGDCGRWGDQLEPSEIAATVRGEAEPPRATRNEGANRISGWIETSDVDCLVIIDGSRTVVGIGYGGYPRTEGLPRDISPLAFPGFGAYVLVDHVAPLTVVVRLDGADTFATVSTVPERGSLAPEENEP